GRQHPARAAAPGQLLQDPGELPAGPARARRARRADPRLARRARGGTAMTGPQSSPGGATARSNISAPRYPTSLGTSDPDTITLLGQNLAEDLMGKVGFGELALWMVTLKRPTPSEVRVFEAVLVALADHGFTPTAIGARITFLSAPDSVQGAIAAGLLGGGSR